MIKHGHATKSAPRTPEYITWRHMRKRCSVRGSAVERANYFDRGIRVCASWEDFQAFLADMGPRPSHGYTLDRIDTNGNYEPGNCRWATATQQNRNRTNNVVTEYSGEALCLAEIAERGGVTRSTVHRRYHKGVRGEALTQPPTPGRRSDYPRTEG